VDECAALLMGERKKERKKEKKKTKKKKKKTNKQTNLLKHVARLHIASVCVGCDCTIHKSGQYSLFV
jgi:hypothetical protein